MKLSIWPNAGQPWAVIRDEVAHCEASGWDGVYVADHFMPSFGDDTGPTGEAVAIMAAIAAVTERVRIGSLVFGNTYRHPAVLTNQVAQIDHVSGGASVPAGRRTSTPPTASSCRPWARASTASRKRCRS
jgi:alkanesulfonate monooxygenase SsuD/methylene tetrahydromethanopterin reductase-like flavin-dependent oxidoreductase (luciferase family)